MAGAPNNVGQGLVHQALPMPWSERPEFPLYVAIKSQLCRDRGFRAGVAFTARRILHLLATPAAVQHRDDRLFTDLHSATSHLIRSRLESLNSSTVLERTGRGLRNSVTYRWVEPIPQGTLHSFGRLQQLLQGNIQFGLDVYRIEEAFGAQPFRPRDFVRMLREHNTRFTRRSRALLRNRDTPFTDFLLRRLQRLVDEGFLAARPDGSVALSPLGEEVAHWFELFTHSVDYA
jgi:hypothetical protein